MLDNSLCPNFKINGAIIEYLKQKFQHLDVFSFNFSVSTRLKLASR